MKPIFLRSRKDGHLFKNLKESIKIIHRVSLDLNKNDERTFEDRISGALQPQFEKFIDQRNIQQKMTRITLFEFDHRPDMSIETDGVAIEVKVIRNGSSIREAIGQAMVYRTGYKFILVILVDISKGKVIKNKFEEKNSSENKFLRELEKDNIFFVVK